ncbi:TolC family protein [Clostridium sp. BJN0001]|uniref:TolC family protein n=1 Tax=Clostridium sp. BJN0001 TaxID=2930219 RepID=UPI001FD1ABF9|nr:TolC family protein [Clostridium sp. BJN0001]
MNRNIKRLIAVYIAFGTLSGYSYPVYAAEKSSSISANEVQNKPVISVDEAADAAIENSYEVSTNQKEIDMLKDKRDFYKDLEDDEDFKSLDDFIDTVDDFARIEYGESEQKLDFLKDKIRKDVTSRYNDLVLAEKELDEINQDIKVTTTDLENAKLRKQLGLIIQTDVDSANVNLIDLQNQKKAKEELINAKKEILTIITGKDFNEYSTEDTIRYNPLVITGSLDDYLDEKIDYMMFYKKKLVEYNDDHADDNNEEPDKPSEADYTTYKLKEDGTFETDKDGKAKSDTDYKAYGNALAGYVSSYGAYLEKEYSSDTSTDSFKNGKRTLKTSMIELYSNLKSAQTQIDTLKNKLDLAKKQMDNLKVTYDVGLKTAQDYNRAVLNVKKLEASLETAINGYNTLKTNIEQPWTR